MRSFSKFLALLALTIVMSIGSVSAQYFTSGPPRSMEQQIHRKLVNLPNYGVFDYITFHIDGSVLTLEGKVNSIGTKDDAARAVRKMPGITQVVNNIEQLPASPFDNDIRRHALRVFEQAGPAQYFATPRPDVSIIVENGRLTLEGYVHSRADSNMLNVLANGIEGVFKVENNLIVGNDRRG